MAPNLRRQAERLEALYAQIPKISCQGHCHDSCGPIEMSLAESRRIEQRTGEGVRAPALRCNMLDVCNRCSVYDIRPMICRLWGVIESMPCPYGCRPEGGLLPDVEAMRLLGEADVIGGTADGRSDRLLKAMEEGQRELGEQRFQEKVREFMRGHTQRPTVAGRRPDPRLERDVRNTQT